MGSRESEKGEGWEEEGEKEGGWDREGGKEVVS